MKGILFTEFNEMVETQFSPELLDEIIVECDLASGGAYTTVGTYDHDELIQMVTKLAEKTNTSADDLVFAFGEHLAGRLATLFPSFFDESKSMFEFMKSLDNHIHVEVQKLYPDAALPKFSFDDTDPSCLIMEYQSPRGFSTLAHGLMQGVVKYYNEAITIKPEHISGNSHVRFHLTKT
ncbi:MAG: hypothetical protein ACI8XG_000300 [Congregibacter sp.]|jgi:hypothetical protein